ETLIPQIVDGLREWCAENHVVSVLLRLHPLLHQDAWFRNPIEGVSLFPLGPTVGIDLEQWNQERQVLQTLNRGHVHSLKYARRCLRLTWSSEQSDPYEYLNIFQTLYNGRMRALGASDFYLFPPEYYDELQSGLGADLDCALAWYGDQPVAGALFM